MVFSSYSWTLPWAWQHFGCQKRFESKGKAKALFLPIHLHFLLQRSNGTSREMQLVLPLLWKVRYYYSVLVDLSRK